MTRYGRPIFYDREMFLTICGAHRSTASSGSLRNWENYKGKRAMPRGSKPGERRGGRQRGTPNKKTALRNAALAAAAANPEISPLEFLLGIMRDPNVSSERRIKVAQATLPFVHARLGSARPGDPAGTAKLIDGTGAFTIDNAEAKALRDDYDRLGELVRKKCGDPLSAAEVEEESGLRARIYDRARAIGCPTGYGLKQAQKDSNRLHQLYCKRISPPSCGGGALSDAEDAEEAQLRARVAAFDESPQGCARRRIRDIEMQDFGGGRSAAEQSELDNLRTLYPDLPLDSDDPLTEAFEAWRRVAAQGKAAASKLDRSRPGLSAIARPLSDDDQP
jgi:hypothetical protein